MAQDQPRLVHLEWDRAHEQTDAAVHAESDAGIIVSTITNLSADPGFTWIRGDEVVSIEDLPVDSPVVRLAALHPLAPAGIGPDLTVLPALLAHLHERDELVLAHDTRTGSGEGIVGRITALDADEVRLADVDTDGRWTGETVVYAFDQLIAVDWADDYLTGLAAILDAVDR